MIWFIACLRLYGLLNIDESFHNPWKSYFIHKSFYLKVHSSIPLESVYHCSYNLLQVSFLPITFTFSRLALPDTLISPSFNTFSISCTLIKMNDILILLTSNYDSDTYLIVRMGVSPSSNPYPFIYDHMGLEAISLIDDSNLEMLSMGSQDEGASHMRFFFRYPLVWWWMGSYCCFYSPFFLWDRSFNFPYFVILKNACP